MPVNYSYILLVHAGSYNNCLSMINKNFKKLSIVNAIRRKTHYYIIQVEDTNTVNFYKKEDLYKLPIMAMREEFSNYIFFKTIKAYNNVLNLFCNYKENKDAPFWFFQNMLTAFEKYRLAGVSNTTKSLEYTSNRENVNYEVKTLLNGQAEIINSKNMNNIFGCDKITVDGKDVIFLDSMKEHNLKIGIIK